MRIDALIIEGPEGFEPTDEICGHMIMERQIRTILLARPFRLLIAGDKGMKKVFKKCTRLGADFFGQGVSARDAMGNIDSLACGLKYLQDKCDRVLIAPASYPFINTGTYKQLIDSEAEIAVATCSGVSGWPVIVPTSMIDEILQLGSIAALLDVHTDGVTFVDTDDLGVVTDVCAESFTDELAESLTKSHSLHELRPLVNLVLSREHSFYGRGIQQMLRLVDETDSMKDVHLMLGMATTHAVKIMSRMQSELDAPLTKIIGYPTKGTALTPEGREHLEKYARWSERCEDFMLQAYEEEFGK